MTTTSYRVAIFCIICVSAAAVTLAQQSRVAEPGTQARDLTAPLDGGPSCAAPTEIASAPYTDNGNTCGDDNNIDDYANFEQGGPCNTVDYPGPDSVYRFVVEDGAQIAVTLIPGAPADMGIFVVADCLDGPSCIGFQDQIGGGAVSTIALDGLSGGDYFIWVDSYYATGAQSCGAYNLTVDGDVPAELVEFTVE